MTGEANGESPPDETKATGLRTRKNRRKSGENGGTVNESEKKGDGGNGDALSTGSKGFGERLRSPLGSSKKLEELRESISKGVEVK